MKNTDVLLIIGCNPAENHPISLKWIMKAKEDRKAKLISVDPRFTRTSVIADIYAPLRPGTDIAFINGIINFALQNERVNREYILEYTNAPNIITPQFGFENGLFTGYDQESRCYD